MEADKNPFPEVKLFHPIRALRELGRKAVELIGLSDPPAYQSDHYRALQDVKDDIADANQLSFEDRPTERDDEVVAAAKEIWTRLDREKADREARQEAELDYEEYPNRWDESGRYFED